MEACSALMDSLTAANHPAERHAKIRNFLGSISAEPASVGDFKVGLEWFNCGEPLSLGRQLRGKIVILDFFTYCCINCLHILPHLRQLEERFSVEDGVVIVGVHSAKFDNEKDSANILAALRRYDITHPVVNDSEGELWSKLNVSCWPTLIILGPKGQPLFKLVGEFNENDLLEFVSIAVDFFGSTGELSHHLLPPFSTSSIIRGPLLFPGKVTSVHQDGTELIAIANSGLHTIIIVSIDGTVKHVIGHSGQPGFVDGTFNSALFNAPQGLAFASLDVLFVADTENHAIRKVDLVKQCVVTVAGNGQQASDNVGGSFGAAQGLSSPWDLCYIRRNVPLSSSLPPPYLCICPPAPPGYRASNEDPTPPPPPDSAPSTVPPPPPPGLKQATSLIPISPFLTASPLSPPTCPPPPPFQDPTPSSQLHVPVSPLPPAPPLPPAAPTLPNFAPTDESKEELFEQEILMIAMAGCHQIWALFFQDTLWWGKEFFSAGTCANVAGSGMEANRNNSYPHSAAFAQPSGLTYCPESDELFIADSESSSVRCINMKTGKVSAVVGGGRVPDDLFAFGDVDGNDYNVKLQHPLGVAWHENSKSLFVADSYNHKIKMVKPGAKSCTSYIGSGHSGDSISELGCQLNEPGGLCVSADQKTLYIADTNNHSIKAFNFTSSSVKELKLHSPTLPTFEKPDGVAGAVPIQVNFNGKIVFHLRTLLPVGSKLTEGAPQRWTLKLPDMNWRSESLNGTYDPYQTLTVRITAPPNILSVDNEVQLSAKLFMCDDGACKAVIASLYFTIICEANAPKEVSHEAVFSFI